MRAVLVLGAALLVACVAPAGRTVAAEPSTICDSGALSTGGSLLGAGAAAWLMAKRGLGPVGATVGGLASEKLGGAIAPMLCNFLGDQLSGEAKAAGSPGPMPWTAPPARLPFDPGRGLDPGTASSQLWRPLGQTRGLSPGLSGGLPTGRLVGTGGGLLPPGLLVDTDTSLPPLPTNASGRPDYESAILLDTLRRLQQRRNTTLGSTMAGSEAARALGTCLSCQAEDLATSRHASERLTSGRLLSPGLVSPELPGGILRDVRSESAGGTTIEFRALPRPAVPAPK